MYILNCFFEGKVDKILPIRLNLSANYLKPTIFNFKPGCEVDGPQNAYSPPNLWEITCRGMDGERVKVPHTSKVASCAK